MANYSPYNDNEGSNVSKHPKTRYKFWGRRTDANGPYYLWTAPDALFPYADGVIIPVEDFWDGNGGAFT